MGKRTFLLFLSLLGMGGEKALAENAYRYQCVCYCNCDGGVMENRDT